MIKVKCPVCGHEILDKDEVRWKAEAVYRREYARKENMGLTVVVTGLPAIFFFATFVDGDSFIQLLGAVFCLLLGGLCVYRQENRARAQFKIDHPDMASLLLMT